MGKNGSSWDSTATERVYRELKRRIFLKELKPGQRLPEGSLARTLSVSRTPVREALRVLANEGLVDLVPNLGARLVFPTLEEAGDSFEVREHLEALTASKAAARITPVQVCLLQEAIDEEEEIFSSRDLERYLDVNNRFHLVIAEASGNRTLMEHVAHTLAGTYVFMVFLESFFDFDSNPSLDEHREILGALKQGDADLAADLMRRHIRASMQALKEP